MRPPGPRRSGDAQANEPGGPPVQDRQNALFRVKKFTPEAVAFGTDPGLASGAALG
jgi:hypothetical protein